MNAIDTSMFDRPARYAGGAAPHTEGEGALPMDIIFIEGFTGETVIGIDPEELIDPQPVQIDLDAKVAPTAKTVSLTATNMRETNSIDAPTRVVPVESTLKGVSGKLQHSVPPLTIQVIEFDLQ